MIDPQLWEWASQLLRWVHVITAIAWIGSSFYFIHLHLSLQKTEALPAGGRAGGRGGRGGWGARGGWGGGGGGRMRRRERGVWSAAPPRAPRPELTWFKW